MIPKNSPRPWAPTLAFALVLALSGCAAQKLIRQGDSLLSQGKYAEAVEQYEEALRVSPENATALERIKTARRSAVRARLGEADEAVKASEYAKALRIAMQARAMPMDLEDVELVRRIDETIVKAAQLAEERVASYVKEGHFVPAVELARDVVAATPGMPAREQWAREVEAQAIEHYKKSAADLGARNLHGAAALQWAMARRLGADVAPAAVIELWNRFAEPTCFAAPKVTVDDASGKAGELKDKLAQAAHAELLALQGRCGEGVRPLAVRVAIAKLTIVDDTKKLRGATPLPGVTIETEETYYEDETYTEVEEVTEVETKKELQEKRDCAPRPGKPRGCYTWQEEVEVQVPVKKSREVQKTRKVKKTRPLNVELPADKVVAYEITQVTRKVSLSGRVEIAGGPARDFEITEESADRGHPEARHPQLVVPEDPLEAVPLATVMANATVGVSREVGNAVAAAVTAWSKAFLDQAREQVLAGHLPEAEELYLKILALGVEPDSEVLSFFSRRYGSGIDVVMTALAVAMGRAETGTGATVAGAERSAFPRKGLPSERTSSGTPAPAPERRPGLPSKVEKVEQEQKPTPKPKPGMSEDELKALEAESLQEAPKTPPEAPPPGTEGAAPGPAGTAEGAPPPPPPPTQTPPEQKPTDGGSQPGGRAPIKPKS